MGNSKHIFVQIDTDSIILLEKEIQKLHEKGDQQAINELVRSHTIIYDQGSMVLGNPIKNFTISVEPNQEVRFAILPVQLYSHHKLYLDGFKCSNNIGIKYPNMENSHHLSFKITTDADVEPGAHTNFFLNACLEYEGNKSIAICIDPVLRIQQPDD